MKTVVGAKLRKLQSGTCSGWSKPVSKTPEDPVWKNACVRKRETGEWKQNRDAKVPGSAAGSYDHLVTWRPEGAGGGKEKCTGTSKSYG